MKDIIKLFADHGTKILGIIQGTVATICGMTGIIPDSHMKYWLAASAVLTYWRGVGNTNSIAQAVVDKRTAQDAAIVAENSAPPVPPASPVPPSTIQKETSNATPNSVD